MGPIRSDDITQFLICDDEEGASPEQPDFLETLLDLTQEAVRQASLIPIGMGYSIKASNLLSGQKANEVSSSVMSDIFDVLVSVCSDELYKGSAKSPPTPDSLCKNYEKLIDCVEHLLGKVDKGLSLCNSKQPTASMGSVLAAERASSSGSSSSKDKQPFVILSNEQPSELDVIPVVPKASYWRYSDVDAGRFVPRLTFKPHALEPLDARIKEAQQQVRTLRTRSLGTPIQSLPPLPHPYEFEIRALDWESPLTPEGKFSIFSLCEPKLYQPLESTPLVFVTTALELKEMIKEIRSDSRCREIAIDVEHHSRHSYRGITCLIQMSTRSKDFIIDPVNIQDELVELNQITADPSIVKVLHSADSDVIWLQRDFGVYIVNLFDTAQGLRAAGVPGGASLANLLMFYCKVVANKQHQLADWRIRPLPQELIDYARSDTHYLLYVFDKLRNEILTKSTMKESGLEGNKVLAATDEGKSKMRSFLDSCRSISLKLHTECPADCARMAATLIQKYQMAMSPESSKTLIDLLEWREQIAKLRDLSPRLLLNSVLLMRIANKMPRSFTDLQALANPLPRIIQEKAVDILDIIKKESVSTSCLPVLEVEANVRPSLSEEAPEPSRQIYQQPDECFEELKINSAVPVVSVRVFSSIRRKKTPDISQSTSLTPSVLDILLTESQQLDLPSRSSKSMGELLGQNGRLAAKAISRLSLKEFLNPSGSFAVSSLRKKRTETALPETPVEQLQSPVSQNRLEPEIKHEVLADKAKRPSKKRRRNNRDLQLAPEIKPSDSAASVLSPTLMESPVRQWRKKLKSDPVLPESFLEEAKAVLPAVFNNNHGMTLLQTPKFFGNSAAQSSKQQTHTKKKKWKR